MKKIHIPLSTLLICSVFWGCASTKTVQEAAHRGVEKVLNVSETTELPAYFVLNTDAILPFQADFAQTTTVHSYFIPAIFFWGSFHKLQTQINNRYFAEVFKNAIISVNKIYEMERLLANQQLEISLVDVPNKYIYNDYYVAFFTIFINSYTFNEYMQTAPQQILAAKFTLKNMQGEILLSGTVKNQQEYALNNLGKRSKRSPKFITHYFRGLENAFYDQSIDLLGKIIDKISNQLTENYD